MIEYEKGLHSMINDNLNASIFVEVTKNGIKLVRPENFDLKIDNGGRELPLFED